MVYKSISCSSVRISVNKNQTTLTAGSYFSLFGGSDVNTYALTGRGRDEQLFAFYLAWKHGDESGLVKEFEVKLLDEAKAREDELYNTFFGLNEAITMPKEIKNNALSIYKEVLNDVP